MKGVICLGEALIDFIPLDNTNMTYQKCPGGAPANVAVGVSKLGGKATFLGKVGKDILGEFLKETLDQNGVKTDYMLFTEEVRTGFTFVTLSKSGERSFSFYIDPSADRFLEVNDIDDKLFRENRILHFGSISMIDEPAKSATKKAVELARKENMIVSYDPNLRLSLWKSKEQAKETIISMLDKCDVLKISEEELEFITCEKDIENGIKKIEKYDIPLIFITMGDKGSYFKFKDEIIKVPAMKVETVDTTGAGDAFVSGILYCLNESEKQLNELTSDEIKQIAKFASVSGGLAASTKGAMTSLPTLKQVKEILNSTK
ncbi:aminoimidazole riboside kinase [Thermohalobacter berrensis]|uniref:Fructokinase n=1 Tax=Thermohalobacter berrensis TaxID=99594 RepID=A0A419T2W5_9FIRM|nr:aminoimidazole riboside kinase [Thermohalobacter berrensis]RKD31776.1 fructokinase [Thermohalobacter berrensis]